MKIEDRYLGDGVYASFDGYNICLDGPGTTSADEYGHASYVFTYGTSTPTTNGMTVLSRGHLSPKEDTNGHARNDGSRTLPDPRSNGGSTLDDPAYTLASLAQFGRVSSVEDSSGSKELVIQWPSGNMQGQRKDWLDNDIKAQVISGA